MAKRRLYNAQHEQIAIIDSKDELKRGKDTYIKIVTCFIVDKDGNILMEQRSDTVIDPDMDDLVSGHVEEEDQNIPLLAMIREIEEEVGIPRSETANKVQLVQAGIPMKLDFGNYFWDVYFLYRESQEGLKMQESEIKSLIWRPMQEVFDRIQQGKTRFIKDFDYTEIFNKVKQKFEIAKSNRNNNGQWR